MGRLTVVLSLFFLCLPGKWILAQADFSASTTDGCTPLTVKFNLVASTVDTDSIVSIQWDFGNGETSNEIDPDSVHYTDAGKYSVRLTINNRTNDAIIKDGFVTVHRTINAAFSSEEYAEGHYYRFIPLDELTANDTSYTYTWEYFDLTGTDDQVNIESGINYLNQDRATDSVLLDTGIYAVNLTIIDPVNGCNSSSSQRVVVANEVAIQNYFITGNGRFFIIDPKDYTIVLNFQVFNRYGMKVFDQTSPVINWNGETTWGQKLCTGVYFYTLEASKGDPLNRYTKNGFIHLYSLK